MNDQHLSFANQPALLQYTTEITAVKDTRNAVGWESSLTNVMLAQ